MTEDEAKTKLCVASMARSIEARWCHASECMAWRWLPLLADDAFKTAVIAAAKDIGDTTENKHKAAKHVMENRAAYGLPVAPFDGFCGLAGKP